jgi:hypothetical protein
MDKIGPQWQLDLPSEIVFTSSSGPPLPNPGYLELYAGAARVAHLSGTAKYNNQILRDLEEVGALFEDDSSAYLLDMDAALTHGKAINCETILLSKIETPYSSSGVLHGCPTKVMALS